MTQSPELTYWVPSPIWLGETVFILGGGYSLSSLLQAPTMTHRGVNRILHDITRDHCVIGLNDAYTLNLWFDMCLWGDNRWWEVHQAALENWSGMKVSVQTAPPIESPGVSWVQRRPDGLHSNGRVGWNWSTGAAAINLALLLGAARVVLVAYDMKAGPNGERNWHENNIDSIPLDWKEKPDIPSTLERQIVGFEKIAQDLPIVFPGKQILNAGPDSVLDCFPQVRLEDVV